MTRFLFLKLKTLVFLFKGNLFYSFLRGSELFKMQLLNSFLLVLVGSCTFAALSIYLWKAKEVEGSFPYRPSSDADLEG